MDRNKIALMKWKEDRDKKKKEAAANKKKPFIVCHAPCGCFPPPPPVPRTSTRMSRSVIRSHNEQRYSTTTNFSFSSRSSSELSSKSHVDDVRPGSLHKVNRGVDTVDESILEYHSYLKIVTKKCVKWEEISKQIILPTPAREVVQDAVGQTQMLMSRLLEQLVVQTKRCVRPKPGESPVSVNDLQMKTMLEMMHASRNRKSKTAPKPN